jgi:hypothetical protein
LSATKPLSKTESETQDTVVCNGYCEQEVLKSATVDVVVGATVGEWSDPEIHVGVTGLDGRTPQVEQWCIDCAEERFGVSKSAHERRLETVKHYVTQKTVFAFALGAILVYLGMSVLLV